MLGKGIKYEILFLFDCLEGYEILINWRGLCYGENEYFKYGS
jgi:hypothetical protein